MVSVNKLRKANNSSIGAFGLSRGFKKIKGAMFYRNLDRIAANKAMRKEIEDTLNYSEG